MHKVFELTQRKKTQVDGKEDYTELKELLLEHMKKIQQRRRIAMLREFKHVKINVEKVVTMCEYTTTSFCFSIVIAASN
ncbi:mixed lineage kinase domain-like protein [Lates japonicus]|uniref:Mixed lineage kinase domain-like protein n=1 Tax=Lates japonicus TaxID=270547 RepID=A0AAD3RAD3_LATJO|nr:mixed lineage kinase domain-like protein [Lates japonicus]